MTDLPIDPPIEISNKQLLSETQSQTENQHDEGIEPLEAILKGLNDNGELLNTINKRLEDREKKDKFWAPFNLGKFLFPVALSSLALLFPLASTLELYGLAQTAVISVFLLLFISIILLLTPLVMDTWRSLRNDLLED